MDKEAELADLQAQLENTEAQLRQLDNDKAALDAQMAPMIEEASFAIGAQTTGGSASRQLDAGS